MNFSQLVEKYETLAFQAEAEALARAEAGEAVRGQRLEMLEAAAAYEAEASGCSPEQVEELRRAVAGAAVVVAPRSAFDAARFGELVRARRLDLGIERAADLVRLVRLATGADVKEQTLYRIEQGNASVSASQLFALCVALWGEPMPAEVAAACYSGAPAGKARATRLFMEEKGLGPDCSEDEYAEAYYREARPLRETLYAPRELEKLRGGQ